MEPHKRIPVLALAAILLLTVACKSGAAPTNEPEPADDGPLFFELPESAFLFGPGDFDLDDPAIGLEALGSYRAVLSLHFDGRRAGQAVEWTATYTMLASQMEPAFRQLVVSVSRTAEGDAPPARIVVDTNGMRFEVLGAGECLVGGLAGAEPLAEAWEPARMLSPLRGAEAAGQAEIEGQVASRYTFDARARGEAGWVETSGEVLVAAESGLVLRYTATTEGGQDYFGEGVEGTLTWEYVLSEIGQPQAIQLPAACPQALASLPLPADAAGFDFASDIASFTTASAMEEVLTSYGEHLLNQGWEPVGAPQIGEQAALASYQKDDQQILVMASPVEGGTAVILIFEPVRAGIAIE